MIGENLNYSNMLLVKLGITYVKCWLNPELLKSVVG